MELLKPAIAHPVNTQVRLMEYDQLYGRQLESSVLLGGERPVDLQVYQTDHEGRRIHALLTDGLSDAPLGGRYFELVWYVPEKRPVHVDWLRRLCKVAVTDNLDLFERVVPMMAAPPLANGAPLTAVTAICSPLGRDRDGQRGVISSGPLWTYWVVPLTEKERLHLQRRGIAALRDERPVMLDPARAPYW